MPSDVENAYVAAKAADDAWSAELWRLFGARAGNVRYTAEGAGAAGSELRRLHDEFAATSEALRAAFAAAREAPGSVTILSGAHLADDIFEIVLDGVEVVWNVTKLKHACQAGAFGDPVKMAMEGMPPADWSKGFLDRVKVDAIKENPAALDDPVIAIESSKPEFVLSCVCDGQHRLAARQELGLPTFRTYIVPAARERLFRVTQGQVFLADVLNTNRR